MIFLPAEHRRNIQNLPGAALFVAERFQKVFGEGEKADCVFAVESGLVKLSISGEGRKEIVLGVSAKGMIFGFISLLAGGIRSANATALTPAHLIAVPKLEILRYCDEHPDVWSRIAMELAEQQKRLYRKIQLLVLHDVEYRLVDTLVELAELCGSGDGEGHSIPLSQEDVAVIIGATRETTSNKLNALAKENLVLLGRRRIAIPSVQALKQTLDRTVDEASHGTAPFTV